MRKGTWTNEVISEADSNCTGAWIGMGNNLWRYMLNFRGHIFLSRYDWQITLFYFRCTTEWFDTYIQCEMIIVMSSYHPSPCKVTWFFFPLTRTRVYFFLNQHWKLQYTIINYSNHVINVIPVTHLFHNWELVPLDPLYPFCPPTPILLHFGNH